MDRTNTIHLDITLEDNAMVADIKKAIKMIKGIASVKQSKEKTKDYTISPELAAIIEEGREEYRRGETITFKTHEEMDDYFKNL